jgi:hypothetical protein
MKLSAKSLFQTQIRIAQHIFGKVFSVWLMKFKSTHPPFFYVRLLLFNFLNLNLECFYLKT